MRCVIVDFGMGNLRSLQHKLQRIQVEAAVSGDPAVIAQATVLFLPGVGFFAQGMDNLNKSGLRELLDRKVLQDKTPILGICLGMQLLTSFSEEGGVAGLGWIPAQTRRFQFPAGSRLKVPHMGWNTLDERAADPLFEGVSAGQRFYFVHSYRVLPENEEHARARTVYGEPFVSVIRREHICGVQFHPEKSHLAGMKIISNFLQDVAALPC